MQQLLLITHVLISIVLIVLVLIQQGRGATMGAGFGAGASATVFGSQGSGGFLMRFTAFLAVCFFVSSLALAYLASYQAKQTNQPEVVVPVSTPTLPDLPMPTN